MHAILGEIKLPSVPIFIIRDLLYKGRNFASLEANSSILEFALFLLNENKHYRHLENEVDKPNVSFDHNDILLHN